MTTTTIPKGALNGEALYLGDNGRVTCGSLRCAGMTAYFSGRDLSGQRLKVVGTRTAERHGFRCETCGFPPQRKTS